MGDKLVAGSSEKRAYRELKVVTNARGSSIDDRSKEMALSDAIYDCPMN